MDEAAVRRVYEALVRIISLREGVEIRVTDVRRRDGAGEMECDSKKNTSRA